jgi:hypothetical protein
MEGTVRVVAPSMMKHGIRWIGRLQGTAEMGRAGARPSKEVMFGAELRRLDGSTGIWSG